jgi:hypothetical protein
MSYGDPVQRRPWLKWIFFTAALVFGQLANYFNPDTPFWGKLLITACSLTVSGLVLAVNE